MNNKKNTFKEYVSIFDRYGTMDYNEHETIDDAINCLEYGSNECLIMDIAVINIPKKEMVWYQEFLGKQECQSRVDEFISIYILNEARL